jgi:hypothetical protein
VSPEDGGANDGATVSTGVLSSGGSRGEEGSVIGRWVTDLDKIKELTPRAPKLPQDVTFVLEGEDVSLLPVVTKGDHQKADDAATPTQLWTYFFQKSFLSSF